MNEPFSASSVVIVYIETYSLYMSSKSDVICIRWSRTGRAGPARGAERRAPEQAGQTRLRSTLIEETLELIARRSSRSSYRGKRSFSAISSGMCVPKA